MNAPLNPSTIEQIGLEGADVVNGDGEVLLIPEEELRRVDGASDPACEHCSEPFAPRKCKGGKPQRFCSPECRTAHGNANRSTGEHSPVDELGRGADLLANAFELKPTSPAARPIEAVKESPWQGRIDRQYATQIVGVENGCHLDVHIEQEGQHGSDDEMARIIVSSANVVRFAKMVLWAAGFKAVGIHACVKGGNVDVEIGAEADQFEWHDECDE